MKEEHPRRQKKKENETKESEQKSLNLKQESENNMDNFTFTATEKLSFEKRNNNSKRTNIVIAIGIFVVVFSISNWYYGLVIAAFFFAIQFLKADRWDKYFIYLIELKDSQATIRYTEKNQEGVLSGYKNEFKIKKETAFNRTGTSYLTIYKNDKLQVKQFEIGDWNEDIFDKIVLAFS